MDQQMLAHILMGQMGNSQPGSVGGMQGQSTPMQNGADLIRKVMMANALKGQMAPPQAQSPMSGMPIQGQGAPGGIAPDQPGMSGTNMPNINLQQLLQNQQGGRINA